MKIILLGMFVLLIAACNQGVESPKGFSLPKGDAGQGKQAFLKYKCLACHVAEGVEDTSIERQMEPVTLGGDVHVVKTYADLVTSVINPSHRIATRYKQSAYVDDQQQSKMTNYNDIMTVKELTDIVAFLQPKYELKPINRTEYPRYFP